MKARWNILIYLLIFNSFSISRSVAQYNVRSTEEGLVGQWIAPNDADTNGFHFIVSNDWFVAIPALPRTSNDASWATTITGKQARVRVSFNNRSVIAPVWDIGPWNTTDDYWDGNTQRGIYSSLSTYWSKNKAPLSPLPVGWDPLSFTIPPTDGFLDLGVPEASQAYNDTLGGPNNKPISIKTDTYNYGCDSSGRHPWFTPNPLNGAGIDLEDGVLLGLNIDQGANPNVSWDFTMDLPSISNIAMISQSGVTLYNRAGGAVTATIDSGVPVNTPVSVIISFNQSMPETQSDDDSDPDFAKISGVTFGAPLPIAYFGSAPVTVGPVGANGWGVTSVNYDDDTWVGLMTIPASMTGPQTLTIQSFLTGFTKDENGNNVPNQLDVYESLDRHRGFCPCHS